MRDGKINAVAMGSDRSTKEGDIINKIGTYSLARLAKHFNIPFYPLIQYPRDLDVASIKIEQRPEKEVFMFVEKTLADTDAVYPSFDITRKEYITKCIDIKA